MKSLSALQAAQWTQQCTSEKISIYEQKQPKLGKVLENKVCTWIKGHSMTKWTRRGGRCSKKCLSLSTFRVKNSHKEVCACSKMGKIVFTQSLNIPFYPFSMEITTTLVNGDFAQNGGNKITTTTEKHGPMRLRSLCAV